MKTTLFLICSLAVLSVNAQNKKYITTMEKNIKMMDTCSLPASYQKAANAFERIAAVEKKEWMPAYYTALCNIYMAGRSSGDKVDEYCDMADRFAGKADSLSPNNSEIYTLKSWICSSRISVNPMLRGAKFGGMAGELSGKAKELDPSNPRPYFLQAMGKYYTPPAFGGGKDKALPVFEEAVKKFEAFKPASSIAPNWGKAKAESMLEECKKK